MDYRALWYILLLCSFLGFSRSHFYLLTGCALISFVTMQDACLLKPLEDGLNALLNIEVSFWFSVCILS